MTFVTKLRLQSGDRAALDAVVEEIRETAQRKGAQLKGPHSNPPEHHRVPQYKNGPDSARYDAWDYVVYSREVEIHGHDDLARRVATREFPAAVHVEAEVDQITAAGSKS